MNVKVWIAGAALVFATSACRQEDNENNQTNNGISSTSGPTSSTQSGARCANNDDCGLNKRCELGKCIVSCSDGYYTYDFEYTTDDPEDPGGGSLFCTKIPTNCPSPKVNNSSTNNSETNNATSGFCNCILNDRPMDDDGVCTCDDGSAYLHCRDFG